MRRASKLTFSIGVALLALSAMAASPIFHRAVTVGHAGNPIAGLDGKAVEHSHERSTC